MEEARLTGVGRGFQRDGAVYAKQRLPNPSKRHLGTMRRFLFAGAWLEYTETTTGRYMPGLYHAELYK